MKKFVALMITIALLCSYMTAIAEDYQTIIEKADNYLQNYDYNNALNYYKLAQTLNPNEEDGFIGEAQVYITTNNYSEAFVVLGKLLSIKPYSENALLLQNQLTNILTTGQSNTNLSYSTKKLARASANLDSGAPDSEKPIIYNDTIISSQESGTIGDKITISVKLSDNVGIKRAVISINNKTSGKSYYYQPLIYNEETDRYEYTIEITEKTPNGIWAVSEIQVYDEIGNVNVQFLNIKVFTVYGAGDSEKPTIDRDSILSSNNTVTVGESIVLSVIVTDNIGVKNANITITNENSNKSYHYQKLTYNANNDRWEYTFTIKDDTPNGEWTVSEIQAYDEIGNVDVQFLKTKIFTVYGGADSEKPEIDISSIQASVSYATLGDEILISVVISDDTAVDRANISVTNINANNSLYYQALTYNNNTDKWEYLFNVNETTPNGDWFVTEIQAYDAVGNVNVQFLRTNLFTTSHIYDFTQAEALRLPNSILIVSEEAFYNTNISSVIIPNTCKTIESKAFVNPNVSLRVFIPDSVTEIADDAFDGNKAVYIYSDTECYAKQYAEEHNFTFILNK